MGDYEALNRISKIPLKQTTVMVTGELEIHTISTIRQEIELVTKEGKMNSSGKHFPGYMGREIHTGILKQLNENYKNP